MEETYKYLFDESFLYDTEILKDLSKDFIDDFENKLLNRTDYDQIKQNYIINRENNKIIYIIEKNL